MEALIIILLAYIALCLTAIYNRIKRIENDARAYTKTFSFHQGMILGSLSKLKEMIKENRPLH